jgi:hypothetical protein
MSKKQIKNKIGILFIALAGLFFVLTINKITTPTLEEHNSESELVAQVTNHQERELKNDEVEISANQNMEEDNQSDLENDNKNIVEKISNKKEVYGDSEFIFNVLGEEQLVYFNEGETLHDVMSVMKENNLIVFQEKSFSGIGSYIYSINDIEENKKEGKYWIYYVNDEMANVGISNYVLNPGDEIEWRLENNNY